MNTKLVTTVRKAVTEAIGYDSVSVTESGAGALIVRLPEAKLTAAFESAENLPATSKVVLIPMVETFWGNRKKVSVREFFEADAIRSAGSNAARKVWVDSIGFIIRKGMLKSRDLKGAQKAVAQANLPEWAAIPTELLKAS